MATDRKTWNLFRRIIGGGLGITGACLIGLPQTDPAPPLAGMEIVIGLVLILAAILLCS